MNTHRTPTSPITQQPIRPLAISPKDCQGKRWHPPQDLSFAQGAALLPVHAGELARAAAAMPLALWHNGQHWQLMAVCGLHAGRNLFVLGGQWQGAYQPACLDSWPLSIYAVGDKGIAVLDQNSALLSTDGSGQSLLDEGGQPLPALAQRIESAVANHRLHAITDKAIQRLDQAGLITPWPQTLLQETAITHQGLHMVDEKALTQLPDTQFLTLRSALPLAYAVNFSIQQIHLLHRLARVHGNQPSSPAAAIATDGLDLGLLMDGGDTLRFG